MANSIVDVHVLDDPSVTVNAVDLSSVCSRVSLTASGNTQSVPIAGTGIVKRAGLTEWTLTAEFAQDFATGSTNQTLWALIEAAPFNVIYKQSSATTTANNPSYTASCVLGANGIVDSAIGDLSTVTATFDVTGGKPTQATS